MAFCKSTPNQGRSVAKTHWTASEENWPVANSTLVLVTFSGICNPLSKIKSKIIGHAQNPSHFKYMMRIYYYHS